MSRIDPAKCRDCGSPHPCFECITDPTEDPAPWCDCLPEDQCDGPCRLRAHAPENCPNLIVQRVTPSSRPEWEASTWHYVMDGDTVRLPGRSETESVVESIMPIGWHADSREYVGQDGKVRDWVTPREHTKLSIRFVGRPGMVHFEPDVPVDILMDEHRRAEYRLQQAFLGSERA